MRNFFDVHGHARGVRKHYLVTDFSKFFAYNARFNYVSFAEVGKTYQNFRLFSRKENGKIPEISDFYGPEGKRKAWIIFPIPHKRNGKKKIFPAWSEMESEKSALKKSLLFGHFSAKFARSKAEVLACNSLVLHYHLTIISDGAREKRFVFKTGKNRVAPQGYR